MANLVLELIDYDYDIDTYVNHFEDCIYSSEQNEKSLFESFEFINNFYHEQTGDSILNKIIEYDRHDVITRLYTNNIMIHEIKNINCIIYDIIFFGNIECLNIFFDNGYCLNFEMISKKIWNLLFNQDNILICMIDRSDLNSNSILCILSYCVRTHKYDIVKHMFDKINLDQITLADIENIIIENHCDVNHKILNMFNDYGYDLDKNKDRLLSTILESTGTMPIIKYLVDLGAVL